MSTSRYRRAPLSNRNNTNNKTKVLTSNKNKYYYIKSINFYNSVLKNIKKASNVQLRLDEEVISIKTSLGLYNIKTNKNSYTAKNILDTRIRLDVFKKYPFMYQSFLGYEIEINKKKQNCFKPSSYNENKIRIKNMVKWKWNRNENGIMK